MLNIETLTFTARTYVSNAITHCSPMYHTLPMQQIITTSWGKRTIVNKEEDLHEREELTSSPLRRVRSCTQSAQRCDRTQKEFTGWERTISIVDNRRKWAGTQTFHPYTIIHPKRSCHPLSIWREYWTAMSAKNFSGFIFPTGRVQRF